MQTNGDGVYNGWHFSANIKIVVEIYRIVAMGWDGTRDKIIFQLGGYDELFPGFFCSCVA